jgi:Family of unknown function (DUF5329)
MKTIVFPILMMLSTYCQGGELSASTSQEITHLIAYLENSGCQFNRNGSWHEAKDASAHINKKYRYLLEKNLVSSAETFIDRAASESSISGKPYQVKCNGSEPVESASWFKAELANYRKNKR